METALKAFAHAHQTQYENRLRGNSNRSLTNAIGVVTYWLRANPGYANEPLNVFLKRLHDPVFVFYIRNLGPRRVEWLDEYFSHARVDADPA